MCRAPRSARALTPDSSQRSLTRAAVLQRTPNKRSCSASVGVQVRVAGAFLAVGRRGRLRQRAWAVPPGGREPAAVGSATDPAQADTGQVLRVAAAFAWGSGRAGGLAELPRPRAGPCARPAAAQGLRWSGAGSCEVPSSLPPAPADGALGPVTGLRCTPEGREWRGGGGVRGLLGAANHLRAPRGLWAGGRAAEPRAGTAPRGAAGGPAVRPEAPLEAAAGPPRPPAPNAPEGCRGRSGQGAEG